MTSDQEYELVYEGIVAIASRCDGAQSLDMQGFDGTDTHFGRRIAAVPFSAWTEAVKAEAARIANKYQKQLFAYIGIDVTTLQVVKDALGKYTNYQARNDARNYENRAKHLASRTIEVLDGKLGIRWANGDPDFDTFLGLVKALPGRYWDRDRKVNLVNASPEVEVFVNEHDFTMSPAAQALLAQAPEVPANPTPQVNISLVDASHVRIVTPYNETMLAPLRNLPGRRWDGANKANLAETHPAVVRLAERFNLTISPEARSACETGATDRQAVALAAGDTRAIVAHVSRAKDPTTLPEAFEDLLAPVLARYGAERALS